MSEKDDDILSDAAVRAIERLTKPVRLPPNLFPSTAVTKEMARLAGISRPSAELRWIAALTKPSAEMTKLLAHVNATSDQFRASLPGKNLQALLDATQPSKEMAALLKRTQIPIDSGVLELMRNVAISQRSVRNALAHSDKLSRIIDSLGTKLTPIGEFEFPDSLDDLDDDDSSEPDEKHIILPREAAERIARVEFLPFRLMQAIRDAPERMRYLTDREFEEFTAELLNGIGFENIHLTPRSGDGGRDVVAAKWVHGIPLIIAFECKRYAEKNKIGPDKLRALLGSVAHHNTKANMGVLVTTSSFTKGSRTFMLSEALVDGKDFDDLVGWLQKYRKE